jgi:spore coat protein A
VRSSFVVFAALTAGSSLAAAQQVTVTLQADRDASIYAEDGDLANGAGIGFHVGRTDSNNGGNERRGLVHFDVSSIPDGSVITDARVILYVSQTSTGGLPVEIHRLTAAWSEGASDPTGGEGGGAPAAAGDVTWSHRTYPGVTWGTAGGDFAAGASATATAGNSGSNVTLTAAQVADDVQGWVDAPASNQGWIVTAPSAALGEAKRFGSRHLATGSQRPRLRVTFIPAVPTGACCAVEGTCTVIESGTSCDGTYQGDGSDCTPNPCPQPTGACCLPDATATCELVTEAECTGAYRGDFSACDDQADCPVVLTPFLDPLPVPRTAVPVSGSAGGEAAYDLGAVEMEQKLHSQLPPTRVWGYDDGQGPIYPGPTIEARRDRPVTVTWRNDLRDPSGALRTEHYLPVDHCVHGAHDSAPRTVVHLHGGHVAAESDGYPEDAYAPGEQLIYDYPNWQSAATLWYHDHALGITRLNIYMGLAGVYLVRDDEEEALGLPAGEYDLPLVIQDRTFNGDGSLQYPEMWMEHFFGDQILVNGMVWPYHEVDRGKYRFRVLNGSNSRFYTLELSNDDSFQVIATDTGLLAAPVTVSSITVGPGERVDLILDFEGYPIDSRVRLLNRAPAPFPGTPGEGVVTNVMQFRIGPDGGHVDALPDSFRTLEELDEAEAAEERDFVLARTDDECGGSRWLINGKSWEEITEQPRLGTSEVWRFINQSGVTHPMHMHLVSFRVLDRQAFAMIDGELQPLGEPEPPPPEEDGWKDTVQVAPNQMVRVIARFDDFAGRFAYHCHMLEHEDHEMMRQFETVTECGDGIRGLPAEECDEGGETSACDADCTLVACGDGTVNATVGEVCDDGNQEDGDECSADCAAVTDDGGGGCGCRTGDGAGGGVWLLLLALYAVTSRAACRRGPSCRRASPASPRTSAARSRCRCQVRCSASPAVAPPANRPGSCPTGRS